MSKTTRVQQFWAEFCAKNPQIDPDTPFQCWFFGNDSELARQLAELVLSGKKTATASLVAFNDLNPEIAPIDNGYSVLTDFEGNPLCVLQTTEIRYLPFIEVDAQFAFDEGEGDQTLDSWRSGHWDYFTNNEAAQLGITFDENALICCERFHLLSPNS